MTSPKATALLDFHHRQGAKMVSFAGYLMPLHYRPGIIKEHLHCRNRAALFDVGHMGQCQITGREAGVLLTRLTPTDLTHLAPGRQQYSLLTNASGGVIDDIIITRLAEDQWRVVTNAARKRLVFAYLAERLSGPVKLDILEHQALIALQGPAAGRIIEALAPEAGSLAFMHAVNTEIDGMTLIISRSGYTGEDGFEISLPGQSAAALAERLIGFPEVEAAGLGARDSLRLEAGLCLYGQELSETITPVEAGLGWLLKNSRHDFPGARQLYRQRDQGALRQRVGVKVQDRAPVRAGAPVFDAAGKLVGQITSGGFSPCLNQPIALALIDAESTTEAALFTELRGRRIELAPCPLPFVPHRYRRRP